MGGLDCCSEGAPEALVVASSSDSGSVVGVVTPDISDSIDWVFFGSDHLLAKKFTIREPMGDMRSIWDSYSGLAIGSDETPYETD